MAHLHNHDTDVTEQFERRAGDSLAAELGGWTLRVLYKLAFWAVVALIVVVLAAHLFDAGARKAGETWDKITAPTEGP